MKIIFCALFCFFYDESRIVDNNNRSCHELKLKEKKLSKNNRQRAKWLHLSDEKE
jgi:hypothetical protein